MIINIFLQGKRIFAGLSTSPFASLMLALDKAYWKGTYITYMTFQYGGR